MSAAVTQQYALALSAEEREVLLNVLEQVLKETMIEEHRTDSLRAKGIRATSQPAR